MKHNIFFKNIYSIIWILLPFIFTTLILVSCQDETENSVSNINHKTMFQGYEDEQIEDELITFLDNLETIRNNPTDPIVDDVMELEPILWYMEACANYKYGASVQPELVTVDTSYVNLPVTDLKSKLGDVQVSFDALVDSIAAYFYELKEEEKYFLMTNISVASQTSQNITLQVTSYFTLNGIIPDVNDYDWYWGCNLGQCGTHYEAPLDAADIIMRGANSSIYIPTSEFYYTDSEIGFANNTYVEIDESNNQLGYFCDYYPGGAGYPCISETYISTYIQGFISIGERYQPVNKELVNYFLKDDHSTSMPNFSLFHSGIISYGIRHYRMTSYETLPNNQNNI